MNFRSNEIYEIYNNNYSSTTHRTHQTNIHFPVQENPSNNEQNGTVHYDATNDHANLYIDHSE